VEPLISLREIDLRLASAEQRELERIKAVLDHVNQADKNLAAVDVAAADAVRLALEGARQASILALQALDDRIKLLNEFRGALTDLSASFVTKDTVESLTTRVASLEGGDREQVGAASGRANLTKAVYAGIAALAAIVVIYFTVTGRH
jgi:hypothetical protein